MPFNEMQITANTACTNMEQIKTWIESIIPQNATYAYLLYNNADVANYPDSQFTWAFIENNTAKFWIRYRSNAFGQGATWTVAWVGVVNIGDEFTLLYM